MTTTAARSRTRADLFIPLGVTLLAAVLRFWNLSHPAELVFDETYYVKDAWTLLNLGYEASWPEGADERWNSGQTDGHLTTGSYVVHPPLGKWIIAIGLLLFGPGSGLGWRAGVAACGVLIVLVTYLLAKELSGSAWWAGAASLFVAIDGIAITMSRMALLDGPLTLFVLLGVWFIALDRRDTVARIERAGPSTWGGVYWQRPWVFAAGAAFGAASAVKWSGLYVLAGFGIYLVVSDALARRRAGVVQWPMAAVIRQGPVSFLLLVPSALIAYLTSWTGWLTTSGGWGRDAADNPLVALWKYQESIYAFHVGLATEHPYASPAREWPLLLRPTAMFWNSTDVPSDDGGTTQIVQAITAIPNPLIWWGGMVALVYLLYRFARTLDHRYALVLVAFAVTYVPWLLYPDRTIFQFYTVVMVPFVAIALALALQDLPRGPAAVTTDDPADADGAAMPARRAWPMSVVWVFLGVVVAVSAFFLPLWTGMSIPYDFWRMHMWLPSWV